MLYPEVARENVSYINIKSKSVHLKFLSSGQSFVFGKNTL